MPSTMLEIIYFICWFYHLFTFQLSLVFFWRASAVPPQMLYLYFTNNHNLSPFVIPLQIAKLFSSRLSVLQDEFLSLVKISSVIELCVRLVLFCFTRPLFQSIFPNQFSRQELSGANKCSLISVAPLFSNQSHFDLIWRFSNVWLYLLNISKCAWLWSHSLWMLQPQQWTEEHTRSQVSTVNS